MILDHGSETSAESIGQTHFAIIKTTGTLSPSLPTIFFHNEGELVL